MSIKLTDEIEVRTKKGKLTSAKQVFLDGDKENLQQIGEKVNQLVGAFEAITPNGGASKADAVSYKNTTSGMTAVTAQGAIDELAAKYKSQDAEITKKANSVDVASQMQTEQTRVNNELAKKFNSENITKESGESEDKVMSQKVVSDLFISTGNLSKLNFNTLANRDTLVNELRKTNVPLQVINRNYKVLADGTQVKSDGDLTFGYGVVVPDEYYLISGEINILEGMSIAVSYNNTASSANYISNYETYLNGGEYNLFFIIKSKSNRLLLAEGLTLNKLSPILIEQITDNKKIASLINQQSSSIANIIFNNKEINTTLLSFPIVNENGVVISSKKDSFSWVSVTQGKMYRIVGDITLSKGQSIIVSWTGSPSSSTYSSNHDSFLFEGKYHIDTIITAETSRLTISEGLKISELSPSLLSYTERNHNLINNELVEINGLPQRTTALYFCSNTLPKGCKISSFEFIPIKEGTSIIGIWHCVNGVLSLKSEYKVTATSQQIKTKVSVDALVNLYADEETFFSFARDTDGSSCIGWSKTGVLLRADASALDNRTVNFNDLGTIFGSPIVSINYVKTYTNSPIEGKELIYLEVGTDKQFKTIQSAVNAAKD